MWKERVAQLNLLSLYLLACFPLLNMRVTVYVIILFTLLSVISGSGKLTNPMGKRRWTELIIFLIPFLLIFIRTLVLDRSERAMSYLEVSLSMAAFPVAFFLTNIQFGERRHRIIGLLFVLSTVAITAFGEGVVVWNLFKNFGEGKSWQSISQMFADPSLPYYTRTLFENTVSIHPTHASLFLGISVLILMDGFLKGFRVRNISTTIKLSASIFVIILLQVALASRTPFLGTLAGMLLLVFLNLKNRLHAIYAAGVVVVIGACLVIFTPTFSTRFKEVSMSNTNLPTVQDENSFNLRTGIYKCGLQLVRENWLLGVGPGNIQAKLNACYDTISPEVYDEKNYNTHNQFIDYWAGLGIAGAVSLLLIFGYSILRNLKRGEVIAVALGLLFFISFLTENILTRQNGVVTFAFFTGLYFFSKPNGNIHK